MCGWERHSTIEILQIKYVKWVLGLDRNTPTYIVLEETKRSELWVQIAKRTIKYEETEQGQTIK